MNNSQNQESVNFNFLSCNTFSLPIILAFDFFAIRAKCPHFKPRRSNGLSLRFWLKSWSNWVLHNFFIWNCRWILHRHDEIDKNVSGFNDQKYFHFTRKHSKMETFLFNSTIFGIGFWPFFIFYSTFKLDFTQKLLNLIKNETILSKIWL